MDNIALLIGCLVLGGVLRVSGRLPDSTPQVLNGFVVNAALPAMTLYYLHKLSPSWELLVAAAMPWLMFALGFAFFVLLGRAARWDRATTGGLILTGSLANTSFVGLPMIAAYFGTDGLATGVVIDQLGSYFVLSTVGLVVAAMYAPQDAAAPGARAIALRMLKFPPFVATLLGLALAGTQWPAWLDGALGKLAATLAPVALLSIGFQLRLDATRRNAGPLALGLGFKLALAPLAMLFAFAPLLAHDNGTLDLIVFEAAMAPMIGATIVAAEHNLNRQLVTSMAGIGIPLSFLTLPVWHSLLA
jgi:hypothetical protein